jgi:hypothetical protein
MKLTDEEILELARATLCNQIAEPQCSGVIAFAHAIAKRQQLIDAALCLSAPIKTARQDQREACANAIQNQ